MLILTEATIKPTDEAAELCLQGLEHQGRYRITHVGDEATVSWRTVTGKHERIDRLTTATLTEPAGGKGWVITGVSDHLLNTVQMTPDESVITFSAEGEDGCPTCH